VLHDFSEQIERLLTVLVLLLLGGAVVGGLLAPLTWPAVGVAVALVFVVRPLVAWLAMRGAPGHPAEHWVIGFFGIRGVGSLFYLAYATTHATFPQADLLWGHRRPRGDPVRGCAWGGRDTRHAAARPDGRTDAARR
jgi:sodium/hydrogen antiporter